MSWFKRLLTPPLIIVASLLMWIEESLWEWLKRLTQWVAIFPLVRQFEQLLLQLPPYWMMVVFLLPSTLLVPAKLLAVYWLTRGYWLTSVAMLVAAKILGTAVIARLYVVCRPKLLTIHWFRRLHDWLIATRDYLYAAVRAMPFYQAARAALNEFKFAVHHWRKTFRSRRGLWARWRAIRRWHRLQRRKQKTVAENDLIQ